MTKSKDGCPEGYRLNRRVPECIDEDITLTKNVNKIHHILGWDEQPTPADEESRLINDIAKRIREEQTEEKKHRDLEGYGTLLRKNKIIKSSD